MKKIQMCTVISRPTGFEVRTIHGKFIAWCLYKRGAHQEAMRQSQPDG